MSKARAKAKHGPAKATYQAEREERERARGDRPTKAIPQGPLAAPAIGEVSLAGRAHVAAEERRTATRPAGRPRPMPVVTEDPAAFAMPAADYSSTPETPPPAEPRRARAAVPPPEPVEEPEPPRAAPEGRRLRRNAIPAPVPEPEPVLVVDEEAEQPRARRRRERVAIPGWADPPAYGDEHIRTAAGRYLIDVAHDETPRRLGEFPLRIDDTVRRTWRLCFDLIVRRRFDTSSPLAEISRTVRIAVQEHAVAGLPPLDAEMLVRAALGERVPIDGIADEVVVGSQLLVFATLADQLALGDEELDILVAEAEERALSPI